VRELGLDETHPDEILEAFPGLRGRRHGDEIQRVEASDGPLSNLAPERYRNVNEWGSSCVACVVRSNATKADFALEDRQPKKLGGRPNRAARRRTRPEEEAKRK
jgi:hypothetical protein